MEHQTSLTEKILKPFEKKKLKEQINIDQLKSALNQWLEALSKDQDLTLQIDGKECLIPIEAVRTGKIKLEFEQESNELEFEIELKWKPEKNKKPMQTQHS